MKPINLTIIALAFLLLMQPVFLVVAQDIQDYPIYVVTEGDTLTSIAQRFGVSSQDLITANNLSNPDVLPIGTRLIIPNLPGVSGTLITATIPFGLNLRNLSLIYEIPINKIARINRLTSPVEVYAGAPLILPEQNQASSLAGIYSIAHNQSSLEISIINLENPWKMKSLNKISSEWDFLPGDILYSDKETPSTISAYSPYIQDISVSPLPLIQGETAVIRIQSSSELVMSGKLQENELHFQKNGPGEYIAIQGIHRRAETGLATISISGITPSGENFSIEQSILLSTGYFRTSPPLTVDPETIDPKNTQPEDDFVRGLISTPSTERYWDEAFTSPTKEPDCITAWFGDERVYNETFKSFHTGIDYGVCFIHSLDIYAPAAGKIIFSGPLIVRGNATIIDHGWGIYSGMWHQKEVFVTTGDLVQQGQLIGYIGDTGRVSGPHLHWELWAGGNQVNPLTWLKNIIP